jgi:protease II
MRTVFSKMHYIGMFSLLIVTLLITSCDTQRRPTGVEPPVAEKRPVELTLHGDTRIDNYYWLNDREDPEVIAYIEAENEYLNTMMAHTERLQDRLYNEMRGRVKEDDQSVPYKLDDYYYYIRYEEGASTRSIADDMNRWMPKRRSSLMRTSLRRGTRSLCCRA